MYKGTVIWEDIFDNETSIDFYSVKGEDPHEIIQQLLRYQHPGVLVSVEVIRQDDVPLHR